MNVRPRRLLIAAGAIVALVAVATILVVLAGSASSDTPGVGPPVRYAVPRLPVVCPTGVADAELLDR